MTLTYERRIQHLEETHRALDEQIKEMERNYAPDLEVEALKKKKLKLKEQIANLKLEDGND